MLISDRHNFIFVHIFKTGGSSITRLLGAHVDEQHRLQETRTEGVGLAADLARSRQHERLFELKADPEWQGRDLSRYRICTVVRSPYVVPVRLDFYRPAGSPTSIPSGALGISAG